MYYLFRFVAHFYLLFLPCHNYSLTTVLFCCIKNFFDGPAENIFIGNMSVSNFK